MARLAALNLYETHSEGAIFRTGKLSAKQSGTHEIDNDASLGRQQEVCHFLHSVDAEKFDLLVPYLRPRYYQHIALNDRNRCTLPLLLPP